MAKSYTIRNRFTTETIVEMEAESLRELVELQVKAKTDLTGADFSESGPADLRGIRLEQCQNRRR